MQMDCLLEKYWTELNDEEQESLAKKLAKQLPLGFEFFGIKASKYVGKFRKVAQFTYKDSLFSFIPGAEADLGWDKSKSFVLTPEQQESWESSVEEYQITIDVMDCIDEMTSERRIRVIPPMLVEVDPLMVGLEETEAQNETDGPIVKLAKDVSSTVTENYQTVYYPNKSLKTYRIINNHHEIISKFKKLGFSFPTIDQWEYICGAGTDTIFRWGNDCPCSAYPTDKVIVDSNGRQWDLHLIPNAFGINIAQNPYDLELVAEENCFKGGDGGGMICGGAGSFLGWLTLAIAYQEVMLEDHNYYGIIGRRVLILE